MNHSCLSADRKLSLQNSICPGVPRSSNPAPGESIPMSLHDLIIGSRRKRRTLDGTRKIQEIGIGIPVKETPNSISIPYQPLPGPYSSPGRIHHTNRSNVRHQSGPSVVGFGRSAVRDRFILLRTESDKKIQQNSLERKLQAVFRK